MRCSDDKRWETACPANSAGSGRQHCVHWYDGDACCACKDPPLDAAPKKRKKR